MRNTLFPIINLLSTFLHGINGFSWSFFCCLGAPPGHAISLTGRRHADHPYPHPLLSESERAAAADYKRAVAAERAAADERERAS